MNTVVFFTITPEEGTQRLDNYLFKKLKGVPKSHLYRLIRSGEIRVNKKRAKPSTRIVEGDLIRIPPIRISEDKTFPEHKFIAKKLLDQVIFEDEALLVINKPSGIAVHGGSGLSLGVIEALRLARTDLKYLELIHRLDKDTSGCLLLAKKRSILKMIHALLEKRQVKKTYWTLLLNSWQGKASKTIDAALEKNILQSGERMVRVSQAGKPSLTTFKLLENFESACLVEALPKTGRTHQIRVHSAHIGHPILGDTKYGDFHSKEKQLYLHARAIQFNLGDKQYKFEAELSPHFMSTLQQLREHQVNGSHN